MQKSKKMPLILFLIIGAGVLLFIGYQRIKPEPIMLGNPPIEVEGKINNQKKVEEALIVVQNNLSAATEEDIDAYVSTLISSAQEATKPEMSQFFKDYSVEHDILSVTVVKEEEEEILLKISQRTVTKKEEKQKKKFRNHISEANHTLLLEDGQWKIAETFISDTKFI